MMAKIRSLWKAVYSRLWLAVLSFFLVITVIPAIAHSDLTSPPTPPLVGEGSKTPPSHLSLPSPTRGGKRSGFFSGKGVGGLGSSINLLDRGRILFEAGRISEASAIWQQAAKEFETKGDRLNQALTLSYLSNAYQELGQWKPAEEAIAQSLTLLENQPNSAILAQALNTQGSLQLAMGQTENALNSWQLAEKAYDKEGDDFGKLGSQINQAQALQTLGLYRRAQITLEQVNEQLQLLPDSRLKATGLRSLGVALQVVGDLRRSQQVLEQSLAISQQLNATHPETSAILFSLGNTARALKDNKRALEYYQKAADTSTSVQLESQLNQLSLFVETQQWAEANSLFPQIQSQFANLSPSRDAVYNRVNFAQSLMQMADRLESNSDSHNPFEIAKLLAGAVQQARLLKDPRAESYALGQLGHLYEQKQQWTEARNLTQQALSIAQSINADDISARWQGQLGGIFKQQGEIGNAIAAYSEAVNILKSLRSDLVAINPDVQFSFQESVEPVYRQLVGLLLQPRAEGVSQSNIQEAREVIEGLQLAELDNFFREACLSAKPQQIDRVDRTAAVIYPIILSDRLEVILSIPGKNLRHYATSLPQKQVEKNIEDLLESLNPVFSNQKRLQLSQQIYTWLLQPAEADLAESGVKTLVFVLDGSLRNLPMSALYDGKQYLVEKYSIAVTPGLQLLEPRSLVREEIKTLTAGLTEARQGFSALPGVKFEVNQIASEVPSKVFLDRDFTEANLQKQIESASFPVVHLATHGQFSSNPEETFILTWDAKIKVKEFENLLRSREQQSQPNPIELLILSACQTAAGDKRAALGLAGVAVRSGARSTLATLWSVKDESTAALMAEFYRQLTQPGVSKAEAIRQAQLALLKQPKFAHPFFWAPFILVGNWL